MFLAWFLRERFAATILVVAEVSVELRPGEEEPAPVTRRIAAYEEGIMNNNENESTEGILKNLKRYAGWYYGTKKCGGGQTKGLK